MDSHLDVHELMENGQRGAKAGSGGTTDNLLIDKMVTLDCHRNKRNLSSAWVDVKKAYDSIDHDWLNEIMALHRVPSWICRAIRNLSASCNTRITISTKQGRETSRSIRFVKNLPQGDALCPQLFTLCLKPVAWFLAATQGYRLSKPLESKVIPGRPQGIRSFRVKAQYSVTSY